MKKTTIRTTPDFHLYRHERVKMIRMHSQSTRPLTCHKQQRMTWNILYLLCKLIRRSGNVHHGCVRWAWGARSFCSPLFAHGLDPIFLQEATRRYKWCAGMDWFIQNDESQNTPKILKAIRKYCLHSCGGPDRGGWKVGPGWPAAHWYILPYILSLSIPGIHLWVHWQEAIAFSFPLVAQ